MMPPESPPQPGVRRRLPAKRLQRRARVLGGKALTFFYRRLLVGVRPLDRPIPTRYPRVELSVGFLAECDLPAYRVLRPDQPLAIVKRRLERGERCYVSWHQGSIVEATWLATGHIYIPYLRSELALAPGDLYAYDSFTAPAHRGQGIYLHKIIMVMELSKSEGFVRTVAAFAPENRAPILIAQRMGAQFIGMYHCLRVGPMQRIWRESWTPEALPPVHRAHP